MTHTVNEDREPLVRAPRSEEVWAAAVVRHDELCSRGSACQGRTWHIRNDYWRHEKNRAIDDAGDALAAAYALVMP